ncbi:MAG: radical SAM protein [Colwellia sp.]|jgi:hypothetical protein
MDLTGHLLYIDITQICGIGCAFCMYADKHKNGKNMELTAKAKNNLRNLINSPDVKRIAISGEGEPLNNIRVFHEILELSEGGKLFEFITSGFLPHEPLVSFYTKTNDIVKANGDICNIRLSSDYFHIEKIIHKPHGYSLDHWLKNRPSNLTLSFRSIDIDREFTRNYLSGELKKLSIESVIEQEGVLEDKMIINDHSFGIDYKNLVKPTQVTKSEYLDIYGYIEAIEKKVGKSFTLGSMNKSPQNNGMDVTVKPSGDVYFYGIENIKLGNINSDTLTWESLGILANDTPLIKSLYTKPFVQLIEKIKDSDAVSKLIEKANNPYWVVKDLAKHEGLISRMMD